MPASGDGAAAGRAVPAAALREPRGDAPPLPRCPPRACWAVRAAPALAAEDAAGCPARAACP